LSDLDATSRGHRRLRTFLLKYFDADKWAADNAEPGSWRLPYALDSLCNEQVELRWSDAVRRPPWSGRVVQRLVRPLERLGAPFLDVLVSTVNIAKTDIVLTVFESQANFLALLRSLRISPYTRPRLAVVSCWLADLAPEFSPARRALYRFMYRNVNLVIYFSRNQAVVYRDVLGVPNERLAYVPFGVDHRFFSPQDVAENRYVLAVGRDRGRDWATLFEAVRGTDLAVKVASRPGEFETLTVPGNVEVLGTIDRATYRDLTARASIVVVPTHVRAYPTGQSVVLESMAMGKCCVVTDTPAMRDYVVDGETAVLVPPHDPAALQRALERVIANQALRRRLGASARERVERDFNAPAMWQRVADMLAGISISPRR